MYVTEGGAKRHLRSAALPDKGGTSKRFNGAAAVRPLRGRDCRSLVGPQVSLRGTRRLNGVGRFHRPLRSLELVSAFYDLVKNNLYPID